MSDSTKQHSSAATPRSAPCRGSFLPKKRISQNETTGMTGMSQALRSMEVASAPQLVDLVEVDRVQVPVDEQDDGQADADLGGRDGDDEQREDLPGDVV